MSDDKSSNTNEMDATSPVEGSRIDPSSPVTTTTSTPRSHGDPDGKDSPPYWSTYGLPNTRDEDGCFVWDPPVLDYSEYIGEQYEKKRDAMLDFLEGNRALTTQLMDVDTEWFLMDEYRGWAGEKIGKALDPESRAFFKALHEDLTVEFEDTSDTWHKLGAYSFRAKDGSTYKVVSYDEVDGEEYETKVDYDTNDGEDEPITDIFINPDKGPPVADNHRISS